MSENIELTNDSMIVVELPKGFMNVGVTVDNHLISDTNDTKNWDTLKFPLPTPEHKWHIYGYMENNKNVHLIDKQ